MSEIQKVSTEHHAGLCSVWRVKEVTYQTLDVLTGKVVPKGKETVLERCNIPLFDGTFNKTGVCRSCANGWQVPENRPATPEEIEIGESFDAPEQQGYRAGLTSPHGIDCPYDGRTRNGKAWWQGFVRGDKERCQQRKEETK